MHRPKTLTFQQYSLNHYKENRPRTTESFASIYAFSEHLFTVSSQNGEISVLLLKWLPTTMFLRTNSPQSRE